MMILLLITIDKFLWTFFMSVKQGVVDVFKILGFDVFFGSAYLKFA
ncbi:hypothetical protein MtrunA17_Chr6g0480161 [Medicago truncatula]|uniref:Uncharacterized protein n=1 Tax=Medicago truncatula TaxID=3880 RepID=A0A396HGN2_MEDTR|nr:hypothetical protein MtrunA17_Chr6g0480161 [Medicago truncatula]